MSTDTLLDSLLRERDSLRTKISTIEWQLSLNDSDSVNNTWARKAKYVLQKSRDKLKDTNIKIQYEQSKNKIEEKYQKEETQAKLFVRAARKHLPEDTFLAIWREVSHTLRDRGKVSPDEQSDINNTNTTEVSS